MGDDDEKDATTIRLLLCLLLLASSVSPPPPTTATEFLPFVLVRSETRPARRPSCCRRVVVRDRSIPPFCFCF